MNLYGKPGRLKKRYKIYSMLYKIINEIANVPNKEILIPAHTRTRSKHAHTHKFHMITQTNINIHSSHKSFLSRTVCQKHYLTVKL